MQFANRHDKNNVLLYRQQKRDINDMPTNQATLETNPRLQQMFYNAGRFRYFLSVDNSALWY